MCRWIAFLSNTSNSEGSHHDPIPISRIMIDAPHSFIQMSRTHFIPDLFEDSTDSITSSTSSSSSTPIQIPSSSSSSTSSSPPQCASSPSCAHSPHVDVYKLFLASKRNHILNNDGWGLVYYPPPPAPHPTRGKGIDAIADSPELSARLRSGISSHCFFAHARAATHGKVETANCHPFVVDGLAFMHNGGIAHLHLFIDDLLAFIGPHLAAQIRGSTDSEAAFALVRHFLAKETEESTNGYTPRQLADAMESAVLYLVGKTDGSLGQERVGSSMNFALTDGRTLVAARYRDKKDEDPPSLFLGRGSAAAMGLSDDEDTQVSIVSSEPLINNESPHELKRLWTMIPRNHLVVIDPQQQLMLRKFKPYSVSVAANRLKSIIHH